MKIIAIETATEACSVALYTDGKVKEIFKIAPQQHTALVLPMLDELLTSANLTLRDIDFLAFGRGPGSFTGLRIATGVVQGLAYSNNLPVIPISTLEALAYRCWNRHGSSKILAAIDARMGELYWAGFKFSETDSNFTPCSIIDEQIKPADSVELPERESWVGTGSGWQAGAKTLKERMGKNLQIFYPNELPHAADIAYLAYQYYCQQPELAISAFKAQPRYLRNKVAEKPKAR